MRFVWLGLTLLLVDSFGAAVRGAPPVLEVAVDPPQVRLEGLHSACTVLVTGKTSEGRAVDLTPVARFHLPSPGPATVTPRGTLRAVADGAATLTVQALGHSIQVPVSVSGACAPRAFSFENDIEPLLGRFGCNSSSCHGKAEGQNGFKLSVFGFDPAADHAALTKEARGRRVFLAAPEHSLLLTKAAGRAPHGGGQRIQHGSPDYETLRSWIAAGAPRGNPAAPKVISLRIEPRERILEPASTNGSSFHRQQLRVVARYSDGHEADVTPFARFQSNQDGLATVDANGLVAAGDVPGDVAIMASYLNAVDVFRAIIPRSGRLDAAASPPAHNFIDPLVFAKLRKLNLAPSELADDAEFLRRVYLDIIGTLPTADEARAFLGNRREGKRRLLVDELLRRPEFADYWALKWSDLLRVDRAALGHKGAYAYYRWIHESLAANKPLDQFARELLTAEGPLDEVGPANFYKVVARPGEAASTFSQVLLGVRIACAECHHHPFDRWSQDDYFGLQAFFTPMAVQGGRTELLLAAGKPITTHPRTGQPIQAHVLGAVMPAANPSGDRRQVLADWLTSPANPWFARNLANRTWAHFLGRGLIEPVDDVRATNPPTNPELLDSLAQQLVESKFDFRQLIRTITASRVYQTSSKPNATNEHDEQNYSRALFKRLDAEVLLDMVSQATGVGEKFPGVPAGQRAIQLWDSKSSHYFLRLFGRPVRASACECERNHEASVSQVLHVLNSPEIQAKLSHEGGSVARLVRQLADDSGLVEELYLTFFSRLPSDQERSVAVAFLRKHAPRRRQAAEDLAWSLLNSLEFGFNH